MIAVVEKIAHPCAYWIASAAPISLRKLRRSMGRSESPARLRQTPIQDVGMMTVQINCGHTARNGTIGTSAGK